MGEYSWGSTAGGGGSGGGARGTVLNKRLITTSGGESYTVPAGKILDATYQIMGGNTLEVSVNGQTMGAGNSSANNGHLPIRGNAGDTISISVGVVNGAIGISGFLYDV